MIYRQFSFCLVLVSTICGPAALADPLNQQQIQLISDTAKSICNSIKEAKGKKSVVQLEGDVKAQLVGLASKIVDAGVSGKASMKDDEFEGLSQDATATALENDRECRERLFNKMFDKLS